MVPERIRAVHADEDAEPILTNSPRIGQLIDNGKLVLSLDDAISLALENNLDIAVERYTPWLNQASLLLAKSGVNGKTVFDPSASRRPSALKSRRFRSITRFSPASVLARQ